MPSARRAANDVRMRATSLSRIYMDICAKVRHASMGKGVDPKGSGLCNCSCRGPASPTLYVRTSPINLSPRSSVHAPATTLSHVSVFQTLSRAGSAWRRNRARRDRSSHINGMASERFPRGILNIPPANVSPLTACYELTPRIGNRFKSFEIEPLWPMRPTCFENVTGPRARAAARAAVRGVPARAAGPARAVRHALCHALKHIPH